MIKTITLTIHNDPSHIICPGHVDAKTFNKATKNEGWEGGMHYRNSDLKFIYGELQLKPKFKFKEVMPNHPKAKKFTIVNWD